MSHPDPLASSPSPTPQGFGPPAAPAPQGFGPLPPAAPQPVPAMPQPAPVTPQPVAAMPQPMPAMPQPVPAAPQPAPEAAVVYSAAPVYDAGQPYPPGQQPYPAGQPYAPQPYPPAQPYAPGYPPGGSFPPPAKKKTWLYVLIGVLVVALVAFSVYWFVIRNNGDDGKPGPSPSPSGPTATAEAAVQGYLDALAAGNAADALKFSAAPPTDTTFLTDAVLAQSLSLNPITNILVTPDPNPGTSDSYVSATYSIGQNRVSDDFHVKYFGDEYLLTDVTQRVNLSYLYTSGIGMAINGVSLDGAMLNNVDMFPGTYKLTSTNSLLGFSPDQFVVESVDSYTSANTSLSIAADAQAKFAGAAQTALQACLQEKSITTNCGFGVPGLEGGATPAPNSATWKMTAGSDDFSQVSFQQRYSSPTTVSGPVDITLNCKVKDTKGNSYSGTMHLYTLTINFSDPDNLQITFS